MTRPDPTATLSRATVAVLAGNAATLVLGTATGALAARTLGPTGRGELLTLQTWAGMLAMVLSLGVSQALVTDDGDDDGLLGPLLAHAGAVAAAGGALFTATAAGAVARRGDLHWDAVAVVGASCFAAATVVGSNAAGLAQRRGRMGSEFQLVRLVPAAATLGVFVLFAASGVDDPGRWMVALALTALVPPLGYHLLVLGPAGPGRGAEPFGRGRRGSRGPRGSQGPRIGALLPRRAFVRLALGAYGTVVGAQLIYKLDMLLVATFRAAHEVAFYGVAVAFATACSTICQATGMVVFSRLRSMVDPRARARTVRRAVLATLAIAAAVAGPVALLAPLGIRVVYGADFAPAATTTRILVLAAIPQSVDYLLIHVLLSFRSARTVLAVQVPVALATVLGLVVALRHGELPGVAAVSGATYTASAAALYLACTRLLARAGQLDNTGPTNDTGPTDLAGRPHPAIPAPRTTTDPITNLTGDPSPIQERR